MRSMFILCHDLRNQIHVYLQNKWKHRYVFETDAVAADAFSGIVVKCHKLAICTRLRSKLKHSSIAAPIDVRRKNMDDTVVHSSACGSYFSHLQLFKLNDWFETNATYIECVYVFRELEPSFPPKAIKQPSTSISSCVDLFLFVAKKNICISILCYVYAGLKQIHFTFESPSLQLVPKNYVWHWNVHQLTTRKKHQSKAI